MLLKGITLAALVLAVVLAAAGVVGIPAAVLVFLGAWLVLLLLAFVFLVAVCHVVDLEQEQQEDSKFYRTVMHLYIEALVSLVRVRIHTRGLENVPGDGRFLLVCNHLFLADPAVLLHCLPNSQLAFITKQENQQMFIVGKIMHRILCQPLDRDNDRKALKTILKCIQLIKEDKVSIGVFPEGYTSLDGKLHHFRPGAFKIAQKANVPIVVCTLRNTQNIFKNFARLRLTDVDLHLVKVLQPEELKGKTTVEVSDMVYELMIGDLGEDFRPEEA